MDFGKPKSIFLSVVIVRIADDLNESMFLKILADLDVNYYEENCSCYSSGWKRNEDVC